MIRLPMIGVEQAAVGAGRRRHLGEDLERQAAEALPQQRAEDQHQPAEPEQRSRPATGPSRWRFAAARGVERCSWRHPIRALEAQQHERAIASTMKVMTNRIRPSAISDEV